MQVTLELLKAWGADKCYRALEWFEATFPEGVEDSPAGLCARIPDEWPYDRLWILHEIAKRIEGREGDEALALLVERAPASWLARAVIEVGARDTGGALEKLCKSEDVIALSAVAERADGEAGDTAARRLITVVGEQDAARVVEGLPADRAARLRGMG